MRYQLAILLSLTVSCSTGSYARGYSQFKIARRASPTPILDTCAFVNSTLADIHNSTKDHATETTGDGATPIQQCLCSAAIPSFVQSLKSNISEEKLQHSLTSHLAQSGNASHCVYPAHAIANCTLENPCGFTCAEGFSLTPPPSHGSGSQALCKCEAPNSICDGQCGLFPQGCPTHTRERRQAPSPRPSGAFSSGSSSPTPTGQLNQAQQNQVAQCGPFETACGTYNGARGQRALVCVDTRSDLESCGGCTVPSPFSDSSDNTPRGVDCSAIEGVSDVSCRNSQCVVSSCMPGYSVSSTGDSCISDSQLSGAVANSTDSSPTSSPTDSSTGSPSDLSNAFGLAPLSSDDSDGNLSNAVTTSSMNDLPTDLSDLDLADMTGGIETNAVSAVTSNLDLSQTNDDVEGLAKDLADTVPHINTADVSDIDAEVDSELEGDVGDSMGDVNLDQALTDVDFASELGGEVHDFVDDDVYDSSESSIPAVGVPTSSLDLPTTILTSLPTNVLPSLNPSAPTGLPTSDLVDSDDSDNLGLSGDFDGLHDDESGVDDALEGNGITSNSAPAASSGLFGIIDAASVADEASSQNKNYPTNAGGLPTENFEDFESQLGTPNLSLTSSLLPSISTSPSEGSDTLSLPTPSASALEDDVSALLEAEASGEGTVSGSGTDSLYSSLTIPTSTSLTSLDVPTSSVTIPEGDLDAVLGADGDAEASASTTDLPTSALTVSLSSVSPSLSTQSVGVPEVLSASVSVPSPSPSADVSNSASDSGSGDAEAL